MGGVSNTVNKGVQNTKTLLSGKGNLGTVGNIVLGNTTFNKPAGWQPDPNANPFGLDPTQSASDQVAITNLGNQQYQDTLSSIDQNATSQGDYANQLLQRSIPGIEEKLNSQSLLNSSALPQELARQASYSAQDVASQRANAIANALVGKQGFQTAALNRGFSLSDFENQAKVAKAIGATTAPQVGNGKGAASGLAAAGVGAKVGSAFGPWGTVIGAGAGYAGGSGAFS